VGRPQSFFALRQGCPPAKLACVVSIAAARLAARLEYFAHEARTRTRTRTRTPAKPVRHSGISPQIAEGRAPVAKLPRRPALLACECACVDVHVVECFRNCAARAFSICADCRDPASSCAAARLAARLEYLVHEARTRTRTRTPAKPVRHSGISPQIAEGRAPHRKTAPPCTTRVRVRVRGRARSRMLQELRGARLSPFVPIAGTRI
jgi:hypothetical protein